MDNKTIAFDLNFCKCKNCGKVRGMHQANTHLCPGGTKTRIGYTTFGPTKFDPKPPSQREIEKHKAKFIITL